MGNFRFNKHASSLVLAALASMSAASISVDAYGQNLSQTTHPAYALTEVNLAPIYGGAFHNTLEQVGPSGPGFVAHDNYANNSIHTVGGPFHLFGRRANTPTNLTDVHGVYGQQQSANVAPNPGFNPGFNPGVNLSQPAVIAAPIYNPYAIYGY